MSVTKLSDRLNCIGRIGWFQCTDPRARNPANVCTFNQTVTEL